MAKPNENQTALAIAQTEDDKPVIYYNPKALPQLLPETRLFLFAQECARFSLKQAIGEPRNLEQEQAADCWALSALIRNHPKNTKNSIDAILLDVPANSDVWQQTNSMPHNLSLEACHTTGSRGKLALPALDGAHSDKWDSCVQACGAKLYSCGHGASCQNSYNQCSDRCGDK